MVENFILNNDSIKFFIYFIFIIIGCVCINIVSSLSSSSSTNLSDINFPCSSFKANYSFDFAFNQIISYNQIDPKNRFYNHFIFSQKKFFKLYFNNYDELSIKSFEFQNRLNDNVGIDEYLQNFSGDFGFSLHMPEPMTSKICTARIHQRYLNCLDIVYRNINNAFIKTKETYLFELSDNFRPSFAFQHISYDHYDSSRFMVIFVEQSLEKSLDNNYPYNISKRKFNRRWQVYSFATMERITNLTYSAIVPEYLDDIPSEFEITGIFGWTRKNSNVDEYMIIVFNGTDHLYCMNAECSDSKNYVKYLNECRAPKSLIELNQQSLNPKFKQQGLVVTKCCGQWEEFFKNNNNDNINNYNENDDDNDSQWQFRDGKLYRIRSARSTNLNYVIWSLIILSLLILLLLICWIYSCINETKYHHNNNNNDNIANNNNNGNNLIIMGKMSDKNNQKHNQQQQQQRQNSNYNHMTKQQLSEITMLTSNNDNNNE